MPQESSTSLRWQRNTRVILQQFFHTEFTWQHLGFKYSRPSDFTESQWLWLKPWMFTVYRIIVALCMLIWISLDVPRETHQFYGNHAHFWFLYATNWAFAATTLAFFLLAVNCLVYNCPRRGNENFLLYQPTWFLYTIASNGIIVVSLVFWVALSSSHINVFASFWGRLKHVLPALLTVLDLCLSAIPIRLIHAIYPLISSIVYAVFSYFFWLSDGEGPLATGQVYPNLNWTYPGTAIVACLCVFAACFLVHLVLCSVYYVRTKLSAWCQGRGFAPPILEFHEEYDGFSRKRSPVEEDSASVTSISTCVTNRRSGDYGAVE